MKHSDMVRVARALMGARETFLVKGPPGGGKTEGLVQAGKAEDMDILIGHPVLHEEINYLGLPGFETVNGEMRAVFKPFGLTRQLVEAERKTLCILDDIGQARLSVQAALAQLVHLKEIDGLPISKHVTFALATNRREDKAAVTGFVSMLLDRCVCVLELEFDANELARYLLSKEYEPLLAAFIRFREQEVRFETPKDELAKQSTPRSIEGYARLMKRGIDGKEICAQAVGAPFASAWFAYRMVEKELPSIEDIVKAPKETVVPQKRDVLYALMAALAGATTVKNLPQVVTYVDRCPPEMATMLMKDVAAKLTGLEKVPAFLKWADKNAKYMGVA